MVNQAPEELKEKGLALFQQGAVDEALTTFEMAVNAYADQDDALGQAEMLNNMGVIYRVKKEWPAAVTALQKAEAIFRESDDVTREAQTLANLGDLYAAQKQPDDAARNYSQAAALFAQCGDGDKQSQALRALSLSQLRRGQWMMAMMRMEESLSVAPRLGPGKWLFRGLLRFALGLFGGR